MGFFVPFIVPDNIHSSSPLISSTGKRYWYNVRIISLRSGSVRVPSDSFRRPQATVSRNRTRPPA